MKKIEGIDCISGKAVSLVFEDPDKLDISDFSEEPNLYVGPGLVDIQVNGIDGVDFNDLQLKPEDILHACKYLLSKGVTTFFPTLITNSDENIHFLIQVIVEACRQFPLAEACMGGIHLEGPFLSKVDGARGAHNLHYIQAPYWKWVEKCQEIAEGKVKLLTMSPEWENSEEFISQCVGQGIKVAIGHSNATPEQIRIATSAGASLSTHLGNAAPLLLPRHPNLLWEQLAQDDLYASIIADGFHLPDAVLKVAIRSKRNKLFLVSDSTCFSGMAAGVYETHIGEEVILEEGGRLAIKKSPELLAGATKCLLEDVEYLMHQKLLTLSEVWPMASLRPLAFLGWEVEKQTADENKDLVVFTKDTSDKLTIRQVLKSGKLVYSSDKEG